MSILRLVSRFAVVAAVTAAVSACASDSPPRSAFPEISFAHLPPFEVAAAGPEVVSTFTPTTQDPHVEHLMPLPPDKAVRTWIRDRIKATGVGQDRVRVEIREASVVEKTLPVKGGVTGFFTNEPEARYEGRATVAVQIIAPDGEMKAEVVASSWRTKEVLEKASLAQREQTWFDLVEAMVRDLDVQFSQGIPQYFRPWLLTRR